MQLYNTAKIFYLSIVSCFILYTGVMKPIYAQEKSKIYKFEKAADSLNFPEGPAWDGNSNLYVSSCYGGYIMKISGKNTSIFVDSIKYPAMLKQTNGLTFDRNKNLLVCEYGFGSILKISPQGKVEIYAKGYEGTKFNRPNDLAFDIDGNLYFTDPKSYSKDKPDGRVFRIDKGTKKVILAADGLHFPNGIAFSADGKKVFVCESALNRILKFTVSADGTLQNKSIFVELPGGDPDGIAFDVEGNLLAAHFGSGKIYVISPEGKVRYTIQAPGKKPSNLEFAGDDMKTLFITEDETNSVYKTRMDVSGLPLFYAPLKKK